MSSLVAGLGSIFPSYIGMGQYAAGAMIPVPQGYNPNQYAQLMQQYYYATTTSTVCVHDNCPVCEKRAVLNAEAVRKAEAETQRKKEEYKKRCEDYMSKFRRKYEQVKKKNSHSG